MSHCLDANVQRVWEIAKLKNLSLLASMTGDVKWQHSSNEKLRNSNAIDTHIHIYNETVYGNIGCKVYIIFYENRNA